jgi:hypothetical protein
VFGGKEERAALTEARLKTRAKTMQLAPEDLLEKVLDDGLASFSRALFVYGSTHGPTLS